MYISITKFAEVINQDDYRIKARDIYSGEIFHIQGEDLIQEVKSTDKFDEVSKITRTEMAEILVSSYNIPFKVTFLKKDGSERVMDAKLVHPEPLLGRSMVEDLSLVGKENALRQVDHRTLQELIVNGVKYEIK